VNGSEREDHRGRRPRGFDKVVAHSAGIQDREHACFVFGVSTSQFPRLHGVYVNQGYTSRMGTWVKQNFHIDLEVVYPWWRRMKRYAPEMLEGTRYDSSGFNVLPSARWWRGRSPSWAGTGGSQRTTCTCPVRARHACTRRWHG
jgi:hypothetical protein